MTERLNWTEILILSLPWWLRWERICLQYRRLGFKPWVGKSPWRRKLATHSNILPPMNRGAWQASSWGHRFRPHWVTNTFTFTFQTLVSTLPHFSSQAIFLFIPYMYHTYIYTFFVCFTFIQVLVVHRIWNRCFFPLVWSQIDVLGYCYSRN